MSGYDLKNDSRMKEKDRITQEAYDNPLPGDYWNEMLVPYFVVLQVLGNGDLIICDVKKELEDDSWTWDLENSKQVHRDYMKRVRYTSIDGFVAYVFRRCSHMWAVDAWNDLGRPFKDTTVEVPKTPVKKVNPMFESILKDAIGTGHISYDKKDMETMYNQIVYECILTARKYTLDKFGIKEPFDGTTEIEKDIAKYFEVDYE
jgi:hypothetical protein